MITYIITYMSMIYYSLLSILSGTRVSSLSRFFYGFICVVMLAYIIKNTNFRAISARVFLLICTSGFVIIAYLFTSQLYGYVDSYYQYRFYYIIAFFALPLVAGAVNAEDSNALTNMERWVPLFSIVFTIGPLLATLFSSGSSRWGGFVEDDSGFSYQSCSYCAAFAFSLAMFCLIHLDSYEESNKFIGRKLMGIIMAIVIIADWFTILLSGGKGGFVTALVFTALGIFQIIKHYDLTPSFVGKSIFVIIVVAVAGYFILTRVSSSSLSTSGFTRIIALIQTGDDTGRSSQYELALSSISKSPLFGHGIGSVYYECPPYSHNFFLDVLVETGVIGLIIWVVIYVVLFSKMVRFIRINDKYWLPVTIFTGGFMWSMFSGQYMSHPEITWAIGFFLNLDSYKIEDYYRITERDL